jgi:tRNA-Thr(GGU) m(6)t(6)A37 methyltransferase TsaA
MEQVSIQTIGIVHSMFKQQTGTPIQPTAAKEIKGTIEIESKFKDGLCDLDGFSHIVILFGFHLSQDYKLKVTPYLDDRPRGLFSTRAPKRPSQIGMSIVRLDKIEDTTLHITGVDMLNGTPVLDIKPYIPKLNPDGEIKIGWLENAQKQFDHKKADDRMIK